MKVQNVASYFIIAVCLFFTILTMYWNLYPYDVITFSEPQGKNHLVKDILHQGENLQWYIDIIHNTDNVKVTIARQFVGDVLINLPEVSYVTAKGHQTFTNSSVVIPTNIPLGKYHLHLVSIFHINPIRDITITRDTDDFTIIK